jgi:hypothetical protein
MEDDEQKNAKIAKEKDQFASSIASIFASFATFCSKIL